uniref:Uncharacterized protein n=1 Tax=Brassica campestris TaxID=3711 RepID=M4F1I0_BRACM
MDETPANDRSSSSSHFGRMKALFVLSLPVSTDLHRTIFFFFSPLKTKPLDSIMDLDRSKTKSLKELTAIWYDVYFTPLSSKASLMSFRFDDGFILAVSLGTRAYWDHYESFSLHRLVIQRTAECHYFVIPLWRGNGYMRIVSAQGLLIFFDLIVKLQTSDIIIGY